MDYITENNKVYVCDDGKEIAFVTFPNIDKNTVDINHTFVDESLRGKGVAAKLMILACEKIKRQGFKAVPTCSYAVAFFEKYKEYKDILK